MALYIIELLLLLGIGKPLGEELGKRMQEYVSYLKEKRKNGNFNICLALMFVVAIGLLGWQIDKDRNRSQEQKLVQKEWSALKEYCESQPETLYLADVFSVVEYGGLLFESDAENLMLAGGWMSASPLAEQRMNAYGAQDGAQALYKSENVVFLAENEKDMGWMERYLQSRFGDCELLAGSEIACSPTKVFIEYRVVHKE